MQFSCIRCHAVFQNPLRSLDRRRQQLGFQGNDASVQGTLTILDAENMVNFCSPACRSAFEPVMVQALKLKFPWPTLGPIMPCGRCGKPVDGTEVHKAYALVTLDFGSDPDSDVGICKRDDLLAVVCKACEGERTGDNTAAVPDRDRDAA